MEFLKHNYINFFKIHQPPKDIQEFKSMSKILKHKLKLLLQNIRKYQEIREKEVNNLHNLLKKDLDLMKITKCNLLLKNYQI